MSPVKRTALLPAVPKIKSARTKAKAKAKKAAEAGLGTATPSALDDYLNQIGRYPLLTAAREMELGLIVREPARLMELKVIISGGEVSTDEEMLALKKAKLKRENEPSTADIAAAKAELRALRASYHTDEEREAARNELITANLRFVVNKAKKYRNMGVSFQDVIAAGNEGLMWAVGKFDPKQARLTTYAASWIQQRILQALAEQGRPLKVPMWRQSDVRKIARIVHDMTERFGRAPSNAEVSAATYRIGPDGKNKGLDARTVGELMVFLSPTVSLDGSARGGSGESADDQNLSEIVNGAKDLVADQSAAKRTDEKDALNAISKVLSRLPAREQSVIRMHYGLDTGRPMTFEQICGELDLSRERVRLICKEALERLRNDEGTDILRDLYQDDLSTGVI
jgi:RNA polymerase primary sigma factor